MSSNGDRAVSVVVAEDAAVVVASNNSDNDNDMQSTVHFCRQVKPEVPKTPVSVGVCQGLGGRRLHQALRKVPLHGVSQVVLQIDQCVRLESPHEERAWHHRQQHCVVCPFRQRHVPVDDQQ
jgi:hypothetical protein